MKNSEVTCGGQGLEFIPDTIESKLPRDMMTIKEWAESRLEQLKEITGPNDDWEYQRSLGQMSILIELLEISEWIKK